MKKVKKLSLGTKTIIAIILMVIILGVVVGAITRVIFDNTIDSEYEKNVTNLAQTVAISVNLSDAKKLCGEVYDIYMASENRVGKDQEGTDAYNTYISAFDSVEEEQVFIDMQQRLNNLRAVNEVESIYLMFVDTENRKTVYIVDGSLEACSPGDFDPLYEQNFAVLQNPEIGFPAYVTNTPEYGWLVTAAAPMYDETDTVFAYAFVDMSMNDIKSSEKDFAVLLLFVTFAVSAIICVIYIHLIRHVIVDPINKLSDAARSYTNSEKESSFGELEISTGDEIENLADAMKRMEKDIEAYIDNLTKVTAEKERIGAELNVATQIQADMLPRIFPKFKGKKEYDLFASMDPAKEVGGDFYDFFIIDEKHLGLVVADVSGKGVPAALFMVIAKTLIKNRAMMVQSPAEVLAYANEQLCEGNDAELFVTVWLAIFDIETGKGLAANAGHEHPAIRRADGQFELSIYKHSVAVATMEGVKFREHEFELHHGDTLFCYTDGVTEATNKDNKLFGNDRLLESLNKDPNSDPETICKRLKEDIDTFVGEAPQFDDITMLCFKYN